MSLLGGVIVCVELSNLPGSIYHLKDVMINIIIVSDLGWNLPLTNTKMMSDASDMLAAALEQMDGIIAGNLHPLKDAVMVFTGLSWLFLLQLFYNLSTWMFSFIGFLQCL